MRLERLISIAWFCFGKSCLSYAIFNFWILSPNNLFMCTISEHWYSFQIPTRTQCKISFDKQYQFMDFSISLAFFEGKRLVTPSEAWHDNSDILVTEKFLKRFTLPLDNPEGRGEGEAEFAPKSIHQTGGLIPNFKTALKNRKKTILS